MRNKRENDGYLTNGRFGFQYKNDWICNLCMNGRVGLGREIHGYLTDLNRKKWMLHKW